MEVSLLGVGKLGTGATAAATGYSMSLPGGGNGVTVPHDTALDVTTEFTLAYWVKLSTTASLSRSLVKDSWNTIILSGGQLRYTAIGAPNTDLPDPGALRVTANTWTHCAIKHSGTSYRFYVGGVFSGEATNAANASAGSGTFYMGTNGSSGQAHLLYSPRIYKGTALSDADITLLAAKSEPSTPPTVWFEFDEGTGTTTTDSIAGLVGTLGTGVTWSTDIP